MGNMRIASFVAGGTLGLAAVIFVSSFLISALFLDSRVTALKVTSYTASPSIKENGKPLGGYTFLPQSQIVMREGGSVFYPPEPKYLDTRYIDIDLKKKLLTFFENGENTGLYRVVAVGPPYSPTPKGTFRILHKEEKHFASKEKVWMPWSMHIVGDIFIHGIPYYANGKILNSKYSHGCIRVPTDQQKELYQKASIGTRVVVY